MVDAAGSADVQGGEPARPVSVRAFEALLLISLGIGIAVTSLTWAELTREAGSFTVLFFQALTVAILLGIVVLVSRRGSNLARWAFTVLVLLGAAVYFPQMADLFARRPLVAVLGATQVALQIFGVLLLFRPDARPFFHRDWGASDPPG